jgi:hypothetical protein
MFGTAFFSRCFFFFLGVYFILFLVGLGFELMPSRFAKQALYCLKHTCFVVVILEMGSCELFAWAGLAFNEPHSS